MTTSNAQDQEQWQRERVAYLLADVPTAAEQAAEREAYDRAAAARLARS